MYPLTCQKCGIVDCQRHRLHMLWLRLRWFFT